MTVEKPMTATAAQKPHQTVDSNMPYADPAESIGYLTRVAFRRFARALEQRTMKHGISSGQWRFLRVLWQEDGISQRELSHRVDMREPTTVVALKALEKKDLVVRERDKADRRKIRVYLTDEAWGLHDRLVPFVNEVNVIAAQGISAEEVATAKRVLVAMTENLAPETQAAS